MSTPAGPLNAAQDVNPVWYRQHLLLAFVSCGAVWVLIVTVYVVNFGIGVSDKQDTWGQFGDYMGGLLNPVFSFASFLILINTLYLQRAQIEGERSHAARQFATQCAQLEEERKRFAEEHRARTLQSFETTFFQLLTRFTEVVSHISYTYPESSSRQTSNRMEVHGRAALQALYEVLRSNYERVPPQHESSLREYYASLYGQTFNHAHELGIYFRTLYHVFKFVDTSALEFENKIRYANIARAQLSGFELALLFYNGLCDGGGAGFRPLMEKYGVLKHVKATELLAVADRIDRALYPEAAMAKSTRRLELFSNQEPSIRYG